MPTSKHRSKHKAKKKEARAQKERNRSAIEHMREKAHLELFRRMEAQLKYEHELRKEAENSIQTEVSE